MSDILLQYKLRLEHYKKQAPYADNPDFVHHMITTLEAKIKELESK